MTNKPGRADRDRHRQRADGRLDGFELAEQISLDENLQAGAGLAVRGAAERRRRLHLGGRTYQIALRPVRYYKPYSITLLAFKHDFIRARTFRKIFPAQIHLHDAGARAKTVTF